MSRADGTPWLSVAWNDLGVTAIAGPSTSARVQAYYAAAGHPEVAGDDTAWCAAFVGACLERAGIHCTRSLLARSYLTYGDAITDVRTGAIAVFARGFDPALGHVAFAIGETVDHIVVVGGNQSNAVNVVAMPRSRLLALRWPVVASAAAASALEPTRPANDTAAFDRALAHVLRMEGGYTDDPYDPGGPTNLGITLADLASYRGIAIDSETEVALKVAVQALKPADVTPIYRSRYWQPCFAPQLPAPLALFHFDTAVNHGIVAAARMLQQALAVDVDGEIGPITLAAATTSQPLAVLDRYAAVRRDRYRALPTFWRFGRGWLARVDATEAAAKALVDGPSPTQSQPYPQPMEPPMTATPVPASTSAEPKWWGQSLTIWGTIITTLATVLPVVGPVIGISISPDMVHQLGDGVVQVAQAIGGVAGILMTVYGRSRAVQPLVRRDIMLKL